MTATGASAALLADNLSEYTSVIWAGAALAGTILLGAIIIAVTSRWFRRGGSGRLSASDQLAQFRALREKGEISEEEFRRVRALLGAELRRDLAPATPAPPPAQTGPAALPPPRSTEPPPNGIHPG